MSGKENSDVLYNSLPTVPDDKIYHSNYVYIVYDTGRKFSLVLRAVRSSQIDFWVL
jgi:hypothetical protein